MNKYRITVLEQYSGAMVAEISEAATFPVPQEPIHFFKDGRSGFPIKVERITEADYSDVVDTTVTLEG